MSRADSFNNGGEPFDWDTPSLVNAGQVFSSSVSFNQDISGWSVPLVADTSSMFNSASAFNNGGESWAWETPSLTNINFMFRNATAMRQDLSGWNICRVTNYDNAMRDISTVDWPNALHPRFGMPCQ